MVEVLSGPMPKLPIPPEPKFPQKELAPPESEQLCGPYGPRFVGYGPAPELPMLQRIAPYAIGAAGFIGAMIYGLASGRIPL